MSLEPLDLTEAKLAAAEQRPKPVRKRTSGYAGAMMGRLTNDWSVMLQGPDMEIWRDLDKLRARCRELGRNDPHAAKFLKMVSNNVVGPDGIVLQMKISKQRGEGLLEELNNEIEEAWERWGNRNNCSMDQRLDFAAAMRLFIRTVAGDGEGMIRKVKTNANPFGFALQYIDADQLDMYYTASNLPNGNTVRMGVERDTFGRRVAFYIWQKHPYDFMAGGDPQKRSRVPADEIIHEFIPLRFNQVRGVPWAAPAMFQLNMLRGYQEAELVAARTASAKMGFISEDLGESGYQGEGETNSDGTQAMDAQPASIEFLGPNQKFMPWDPQHPTAAFPNFMKTCMESIASGLGVSYAYLTSDLSNANYSSSRVGLLEERSLWKEIQKWFISHIVMEIFKAWLPMAWLNGQISQRAYDAAVAALDDCDQIKWHARGWDWVDPKHDMEAAILATENGFTTRTAVLGEVGKDFEDTIAELKHEDDVIKKSGLTLGTDAKGVADTASDDQSAAGEPSGASKGKAAGAKK